MELNRNTDNRNTIKANTLRRNGEKCNAVMIILYKGVDESPSRYADFVMKAGNHNPSAIATTDICCDKKLCLKKFNIRYYIILRSCKIAYSHSPIPVTTIFTALTASLG